MRHGAAFQEALRRLASEGRLQQIRHNLPLPFENQLQGSLAPQIRMRTIHPCEDTFFCREELHQDCQASSDRYQMTLHGNRSRALVQPGDTHVRKLGKTRKRRSQEGCDPAGIESPALGIVELGENVRAY